MTWLWLGLGVLAVPLLMAISFHLYILIRYLNVIVRIFQERPLFIVPQGQPVADAENVVLASTHGVKLQGCYLKARGNRQGVILFGLEFGSNRWSSVAYTDFLREAGYDIFAFEMRGQGQSPAQSWYQPLQWVTEYEVEDFLAAVDYLKKRPDADPRGIGFFGISKGGSAGLFVACEDPYIRCCVTDGVFATHVVLLPYMLKWIYIFTRARTHWVARVAPTWYYFYVGRLGLRLISQERRCSYPQLEEVIRRLTPRPWLMIHGGADTYIEPDMARALFERAGEPKEIWVVDKAKHNQAMQVADGEYQRRIREFFERHLANRAAPEPSANGATRASKKADIAEQGV